MNILILSPYLPSEFSGHAGAQLIFRNIISISKKHNITLACFINSGENKDIIHLEDAGINVYPILYFRAQKSLKNKIYSLFQNLESIFNFLKGHEPFFFAKYNKKVMKNLVKKIVYENEFDIVQIEYNIMYHYIDLLGEIPKIINFHDVSTKVYERGRRYKYFSNNRYYKMVKKIEPFITTKVDSVITLSNEDKVYLTSIGCDAEIHVIPPQIKIPESLISFKKKNEICFFGSFSREPNVQAVNILIDKILPQLSNRIKLNIIGLDLPNSLVFKINGNSRINYLGFIEDIDSFISTQMITVSPILIGAGIKMKNLHSLACSTAVLTTPIGAEGINIDEDNGLWISNIISMGGVLNTLLENDELLIKKGQQGKEIVKQFFSENKIISQYESLYSNLIKK